MHGPQMAIGADPKNPLAKFERANVLLSMDRLDEALAELQVLKVRRAGASLQCSHVRTPDGPMPEFSFMLIRCSKRAAKYGRR